VADLQIGQISWLYEQRTLKSNSPRLHAQECHNQFLKRIDFTATIASSRANRIRDRAEQL
jgi:hypothetical protein